MTYAQRRVSQLVFLLGCAPALSVAAPIAATRCSVDQLQAVLDDGSLETIEALCDTPLKFGLEKVPVNKTFKTVCTAPRRAVAICTLGPRRSTEMANWRAEFARRKAFAAAWGQKCATDADPSQCKTRAPLVYAAKDEEYDAVGLDEAVYEAALRSSANRTKGSGAGPLGGGDWTSNLVMGLVDFAIARADAEMNRFVLARVRERVCVNEVGEVLPRTCGLIGGADAKDPAAGTGLGLSFGSAFQAALADDLRGLPTAIAEQLDPTEANLGLYATLSLIDGVVQGAPLDETVGTIAAFARRMPASSMVRWQLRGGLLLMTETRACLAEKAKDAKTCAASTTVLVSALLGRPPTSAQTAMLMRMIAAMQTMTARMETLKTLAAATKDVESSRALMVEVRGELWLAMAQAIDAALAILDPDDAKLKIPPDAIALARAALHRNVADVVSALLGLLHAYSESQLRLKLPPEALRLMSFGADLAAAKTSDDAAAAFDAFAAPIGSWQLKRQAGRTTSVGLLIGASAGVELLRGDTVRGSEAGGVLAVTGLVGLDLSWQLRETCTWGLFLGLIDLGGLINTRLSSSETIETEAASDVSAKVDSTPEFDLTQLLAPSVSVRFGLGKSPVVVGAGVEYVPRARSVLASGIDEEDVAALRGLVFLALDIPVFYF